MAYSEQHQLKLDYHADKANLSNGQCIKKINVSTADLCQVNDLAENIIIKGQCSVFDEPKNIYDHNIVTNQKLEIKRYSIIGAENNILRLIRKMAIAIGVVLGW